MSISTAAHESLRGRVVLVTGASRGIGREFVRTLAQAGAKLTLVASRISEALRICEQEVRALALPGHVLTIPIDVRDAYACERAVRATVEEFGRIDALVNNAGVGGRLISETYNIDPVPFWEGGIDAWQQIIETNVLGAFFMARAAAPRMVKEGFGRIVSISTSPQTMIRRGYSPYGPSKAALEAMTRIWSQDLDGTGVTANILLPGGATDTDFIPRRLDADRRGADGMLLPASVMNDALLWLLSDQSNTITGRRFVGRLWDANLAPSEAAQRAIQSTVNLPAIL
jgi:NAD(P)-dependent dehydrogenase (short-subunit alcohol dehydrogenase family)